MLFDTQSLSSTLQHDMEKRIIQNRTYLERSNCLGFPSIDPIFSSQTQDCLVLWIRLYDLLPTTYEIQRLNVRIYHFHLNYLNSPLFLQKSCIVLYNSCFSLFAYLKTLSKIYENPNFRHF